MSHLVDPPESITPRYVILKAGQKVPERAGWPALNPTDEEVQSAIDAGKNLGMKLGPGSVIDLEVDGPEGEASLRKLFGGEPPPAPCWESLRGKHRLY